MRVMEVTPMRAAMDGADSSAGTEPVEVLSGHSLPPEAERMNVVEIRQESELRDLRPGWENLLRESASNTIFLTWEWATAWWSAYGNHGDLRMLAAFDESGALRGVAPLRSQTFRRYGQSVPALSFVGDGSNDSDYLDFLISSGFEERVMHSLRSYLMKELDQGRVLLLNEIPETSPNISLVRRLAELPGMLWTKMEVPCGVVRLPKTWELYLSMLRPRFRTKVRSVLHNLQSRPEVQFGFCEDSEQVHRMLPVLFDLHTSRWAMDGKPGVFGWEQKRTFYFELSNLLLQRGWLRFSWLKWNGHVLACQFGFAYAGSYFQLQEGYEPACEHWNVGIGLRAWSIGELLKEGIREYDFLGGIGRHKSDWGCETKLSKKVFLARRTSKNLLICCGPEWETRATESLRRIVPEKILLARQGRIERQRLAAFRQTQNGCPPAQSREWIRKATANCYFHLKLPALLRPWRERFRLTVSNHGEWPGIFWSKRKEASARVLYYHRVNDENDPFFPAISTALFEQQMRFVAQHYKVVSLAKLLDHLENGTPQSVLAITFDDGYEDNFLNAFPILRRYNLPATIFLTTGGTDTRDALWFEQLAEAVKRTDREFIDLEIDLPRRFWLRTQDERLRSNDGIFSMLRRLPDEERQQRLVNILRQLAVTGNPERRNKMLTWDQVRLMMRYGIDFGGHTVTHPFLSKVTREKAAWEVSECKRRIEEELQQPVSYFAYPNGREEDFTSWNKEMLRNAGYRAALSTIWGMNYRSTDRMQLKRGGPWEKSQALFAWKLDWYQWTEH